MTLPQFDVVIIGAGIAGASAAWFARRAGREVCVIDASVETASLVPTALINPMRGYQGKLDGQDVAGARFSLQLIEELIAQGHALAYGRGLWRPAPDALVHELWLGHLGTQVPYVWHAEVPVQLQLRQQHHGVLYLPDSGWVESKSLLQALLSASACERITAQMMRIDVAARSVDLQDGTSIRARDLLWCGGAWGAAQLGWPARYRPGSLMLTSARLSDEAISYGLYAAPNFSNGSRNGSVIGPTTEPIASAYDMGPSPSAWVERSIERAHKMFATPFQVEAQWHGVRLESFVAPAGLECLTGFGSRGYLLAPMLAERWSQKLPRA